MPLSKVFFGLHIRRKKGWMGYQAISINGCIPRILSLYAAESCSLQNSNYKCFQMLGKYELWNGMWFRCHVCYLFWSCQRIPKVISRLLTLQLETAVEIHVWRVFPIQMLHWLTGVRHVWSDPSQLLGGTLLTSKVFNFLLHFDSILFLVRCWLHVHFGRRFTKEKSTVKK